MSQKPEFTITKKTVTIDKELCINTKVADVEFNSQVDAIANLIETHSKDGSDRLTKTPVFKAMLEAMADALEEWEECKQSVLNSVKVEEGMQINNWKLDYETCQLQFDLMQKPEVNTVPYAVNEELCHRVQEIHKMCDAITAVVNDIISMHVEDSSSGIVKSPVFKGFMKLKAHYLSEFSDAKVAVQKACLDPALIERNPSWSLDYKTKTLTVEAV